MTLGRTATRLHLLLVIAMSAPAVIILALVVAEVLENDPHAHWVLGLILTAPLWLVGLVAIGEVIRVLRGGVVGAGRGLLFALVAITGGVLIAWGMGLLSRPKDVLRHVDPWDAAGVGLLLAWLLLGASSLLAIVRDRRSGDTAATTGDVHGRP